MKKQENLNEKDMYKCIKEYKYLQRSDTIVSDQAFGSQVFITSKVLGADVVSDVLDLHTNIKPFSSVTVGVSGLKAHC